MRVRVREMSFLLKISYELTNIDLSLKDRVHVFYKYIVFQSEAKLSFSQIHPQNMLKICLSKKIEKSKFHDFTHV